MKRSRMISIDVGGTKFSDVVVVDINSDDEAASCTNHAAKIKTMS